MKLYVTLRSIPQFSDLSKDELRKKYRSYYPMLLNRCETWIALGIGSMSFVALEWFIRDGFEVFHLKPFSVWLAVLFRVGLYSIVAFLYRIIFYGIIASQVNTDANSVQLTDRR